MKYRKITFFLLLCILLFSSCTEARNNMVITTPVPGVNSALPELSSPAVVKARTGSILYFRYLDEPYLAPEVRTIRQIAGQTYEYALISALIGGPGTHSVSLNGLFPEGVRLLSSVRQGRMLFVTLSSEIMNTYTDEPDDWQNNDAWRQEVPLRRTLCMQSLVATITENCDVDQVQILVQGKTVTDSMRLKQNYFMDDAEDDVLVGPQTRNDGMILSQQVTADVILHCWKQRDWLRLYKYITYDDNTNNESYALFVETMEKLPAVLNAEASGGTVSPDGSQATFTMQAETSDNSIETEWDSIVIHLTRENSIWKITEDELISWLKE